MVAVMRSVLAFGLICLLIETTFGCRYMPTPETDDPPSGTPGPDISPAGEAPASEPGAPPSSTPPTLGPAPVYDIFDVTDYGAVADGMTDNQMAFQNAWSEACDSNGQPTFLIPNGTYFVSPIAFEGPCCNKNSLNIEIAGTLKAPTDPNKFDGPSWIIFKNLNNFIVSGRGTGLIDGEGKQSWDRPRCLGEEKCKQYPHSIRFQKVTNATIIDIALLNSKCFHISFLDSNNVLVHKINITAPGNSRNTDGIHISHSSNINITSSNIGVGDDCVSIGPSNTNISILGVNCGPGHGISVGSLGKYDDEKDVVGVSVKNCTINGTTNGVRIKTWPGEKVIEVHNITFEDVRMINVSNPIIIDQKYCPGHGCDSNVSSVKLNNIQFKNIIGTSRTNIAVNLFCSPRVPCKNVQLENINLTTVDGSASAKSACFNVNGTYSGMKTAIPCSKFRLASPLQF